MKVITDLISAITNSPVPDYLADEIKASIIDKRFEFIKKGDIPIGFFTWHYKEDRVFINNACILPQFRDRNNFLFLRKYLRNKLPEYKNFYWENNKKAKEVAWTF